MIYIDLFSGIGGFAIGAYWSGIRFDKHYFSEVDEYAVELYRKRCPDAISLGDITKVDWKALADTDRTRELQPEGCKQKEWEWVSNGDKTEYIITGGFPCQDLSVAGKGAGLEGERSGLWTAMFEAIRILRPRYVIIENVGAIVGWFPRIPAGQPPDNAIYMEDGSRRLDIEQYQAIEPVLNDLNSILYDAEGQNIRAEDMGAPHERKRIWIVAYPSERRTGNNCGEITNKTRGTGTDRTESVHGKGSIGTSRINSASQDVSNPDRKYDNNAGHGTSEICRERSEPAEIQRCENMADTGQQRKGAEVIGSCGESKYCEASGIGAIKGNRFTDSGQGISNTTKPGLEGQKPESKLSGGKPGLLAECNRSRPGEWLPEPCMGMLVDGLPSGLDRFEGRLSNKSYKKAAQIKGIGNAIVPQIAELFFLWIKELLWETT